MVDIRFLINILLVLEYSKRRAMYLAFIPTSLSALVIILPCIALRALTKKAKDIVIVPGLLPRVENLLGFALRPLDDCRCVSNSSFGIRT